MQALQAFGDAAGRGGPVQLTDDPRQAAKGAAALYTDVWTSMGQEDERAARLAAFAGFTVDDALVDLARADVVVLHCLPAHRGEEITDAVLEGPPARCGARPPTAARPCAASWPGAWRAPTSWRAGAGECRDGPRRDG